VGVLNDPEDEMETVESIESGKVSDGREVAMESVLVDKPIDKGSDDDVVGMYVKNAARSRSERTHWGPPTGIIAGAVGHNRRHGFDGERQSESKGERGQK